MDTLTQALLGGAVGYAVSPKENKRRGMLWGAGIAVLPDLDIFIPYETDLESMTYHRSWSHSWIIQTLFAPLLALLIFRLETKLSYANLFKITWLALVTHSALDALTVYGTQLFWPFMPPPVSIGSVFIIDPLYSVPLLTGFLAILWKPKTRFSHRLMTSAFVFSCLYLAWGLSIQQWLQYKTKQQLTDQTITYHQIKVLPTPFNSFLWRILVVGSENYHEGFVSIFDQNIEIQFEPYPRGKRLVDQLNQSWSVERIRWFTNDIFKLEMSQGNVIAKDLRMGMEPNYVFSFKIAECEQKDDCVMTPPNRVHQEIDTANALKWVWQRIWHQDVSMTDH